MTELPRILKVLIWPFVAAAIMLAVAGFLMVVWVWMLFERGTDAE